MKKSIQRTLCFVRKPAQAALTAIVCFAIFFASVSCASLPKGGRSAREQTENADGAPESVQHENAFSVRESSGGAEKMNANGGSGGTEENDVSGASDEHTAPDTETMAAPDRMTEERASNTENLAERVGGELPEKSEEAMRGSPAIDEPRVREGFPENGGRDSAVTNEALSARVREDAARENESAVRGDVPAAKEADDAATQSTANPANAANEMPRRAQRANGSTSEVNRRGQRSDTPGAQAAKVIPSDAAPNGTEDLRDTSDSATGADTEDTPLPSRSVRVAKNQYLDVVYPGGGWIYLGETDGTKLLSFFGKRLGDTDTVFTLRAKNAGKAILHFYKNDILTGNAIDDYLEAIVEDRTGSATDRITAPSYADIVPSRPASSGSSTETQEGNGEDGAFETAQNGADRAGVPADSAPLSSSASAFANGGTGENASAAENNAALSQNATKQTKALSTNVLGTDDYALGEEGLLEKAKSAYDEKNYARALALLDLFFARATSRIDEGLYLKGQTLEAKSAQQNIKGAIGAYDELLQKWPESKQWQAARRRSIYLKRMYVDIR